MNIRHSHRSFVQDRPVTNLIELFEEIKKNDEVRIVDTVYMDFSKTLDKIPYSRLVQKIKLQEFQLVNWIQNWLGHRKQRVAEEGCDSDWRSLANGVSQASMLCHLDENVDGRLVSFQMTQKKAELW